jgi:hypothetical protein
MPDDSALTRDEAQRMQVCGHGAMWLRTGEVLPDELQPLEAQALAALREVLYHQMLVDASARGLQLRSAGDASGADEAGAPPCDKANNPACEAVRDALAQSAFDDWYRRAAQSDDTQTYLLARDMCAQYGYQDCVQQFSAARWAEFEPDNSAAWIAAAAEAHDAHDSARAQDALRHAAASTRHVSAFSVALTRGEAALDTFADPLQRGLATHALWEIALAAAVPPYAVIDQYCDTDRQGPQSLPRGTCLQLAEHLAQQSDTAVGSMVGARLFDSMRADGAIATAARDRGDALRYALNAQKESCADATQRLSCDQLDAARSYLHQVVTQGETQALQASLRAAGLSDASAAARLRAARVAEAGAVAQKTQEAITPPFGR